MLVHLLIIILGFILLIYGADLLVKGASGIAKKLHIPEIIVGLTIVSLGTSLPELVITLVSSSKESENLIIGNVIGSNLCNLLFVLGIITIIKPIHFEKSTIKWNLPILILINAIILILGFIPIHYSTFVISSFEGFFLLFLALVYLLIPFIKQAKNKSLLESSSMDTSQPQNSTLKHFIFIILGGFFLKYGGNFVVEHSIQLAHLFHISESIIGFTIIAFGTSLPEFITSLVAIIKGNNSIAEGNLIGSCIINFCLILGFGAILSDIALDRQSIENLILLFFSSIFIWLYSFFSKNHLFKKANGFILLILYGIYLLRLLFI